MANSSMDTLNAKRLTPSEVASSFVAPVSFDRLSGKDHIYVIGPRGSGKTTLLRMLTGESLAAWPGDRGDVAREKIRFSAIFLPADELWASQTTLVDVRAAFNAQALIAFVETLLYRTSGDPTVHLPASLELSDEGALASRYAQMWGITDSPGGLQGLLSSLEQFLLRLDQNAVTSHPLAHDDGLRLLSTSISEFNRAVHQPHHQWALLLDEMELAPSEVHRIVTSFVRGGPVALTLKISMSPFDRYMDFYGAQGSPVPGHDFQTIYLSGQEPRELRRITYGLWDEALRARGLPPRDFRGALSSTEATPRGERISPTRDTAAFIADMARRDRSLREWLQRRGLDPRNPSRLTYLESSATIRKITPLLVYRDALLNFRDGNPVKRSRKKSLEPFTGPASVISILEGNPRWIKSAFTDMLERYDRRTRTVSLGFQYDALISEAGRFEALLRVLPMRESGASAVPTIELVDKIARYLHDRNTTVFSADAPNTFTVDARTPPDIQHALTLGLYAGAFVHLRDRRSPAILSSFAGQRFRLTNLLAIRDGKELPLRLGKDISLGRIYARPRRNSSQELPLDWNTYETK